MQKMQDAVAKEQKKRYHKHTKTLHLNTKRKALEAQKAKELTAQRAKALEAQRLAAQKAKALAAQKEQARLAKEAAKRKALEAKKAKELAAKRLAAQKEQARLAKEAAKRKALQEQKEKLALARALQKQKEAKTKAKLQTQNTYHPGQLIFVASKQTYQKFGTSEIHGHVVYLTPSGQEITLEHTKVYLIPKNTKTDYWYKHFYLKNKDGATQGNITLSYINATHLNIDKNFAFYGLATGKYYIVIESSYPASVAKNRKVYIAKEINVEKYKKIMTVLSRRL
jgi:hypothetical protein